MKIKASPEKTGTNLHQLEFNRRVYKTTLGKHISKVNTLSCTQNVWCWTCDKVKHSKEFTRAKGEAGHTCKACRAKQPKRFTQHKSLAEAEANQ